jgi:hypothetical protein
MDGATASEQGQLCEFAHLRKHPFGSILAHSNRRTNMNITIDTI